MLSIILNLSILILVFFIIIMTTKIYPTIAVKNMDDIAMTREISQSTML